MFLPVGSWSTDKVPMSPLRVGSRLSLPVVEKTPRCLVEHDKPLYQYSQEEVSKHSSVAGHFEQREVNNFLPVEVLLEGSEEREIGEWTVEMNAPFPAVPSAVGTQF